MNSDRASSSNMYSTADRTKDRRTSRSGSKSSDKSYEIFRNKTTSVEVIVKEVPKHQSANCNTSDELERLQDDNKRLREELCISEAKSKSIDHSISYVVFELKKQLDMADARELAAHKENVALKLDNEKLKTILQSNELYKNKLKKELLNMRRMIKLVVKGILNTPTLPEYVNSEPEYENFETDLLKNFNLNFPLKNSLEVTGATGDSSLLEDTANLSSPPRFMKENAI